LENWEAEDDVRSSRWHLTDCQFSQGEDSGNVPIGMCAMRHISGNVPIGIGTHFRKCSDRYVRQRKKADVGNKEKNRNKGKKRILRPLKAARWGQPI